MKKKFGDLKSTILEVKLKNKLSEAANGKTVNNELESHNSLLGLKIDSYRKSMKRGENKCLQPVLLMADIINKCRSSENSTKQIQRQVAATKTYFKTHQEYIE